MDRKKTLANEYKQRKIVGGIYRVTNTCNGMYLLDYTANLPSKQNSFNFTAFSGSCFDYRLKEDWVTFGGKAFIFEILETLERKTEQTQDAFINDLKMLKQLWDEKLDPSIRY